MEQKKLQDKELALEKKEFELDVERDLVEEIGTSLKIPIVAQRIINALYQILPHPVSFAYIILESELKKTLLEKKFFVHTPDPLGEVYFAEQEARLKKILRDHLEKIKNLEAFKVLLQEKWEPIFVAGSADNSIGSLPKSVITLPFFVGEELVGIIDISSVEPDKFSNDDLNASKNIINIGSSTVLRLRNLFESEQSRVQSLIRSLTDGVVMFDTDKNILFANPTASKMTGLPTDGFYLSEFATISGVEDILEDNIKQVLEKGELSQLGEIVYFRHTCDAVVAPIFDNKKNIIGGAIILHDITHLKEVDKMKTEFVSLASHQLKTPVGAIGWNIEMLLEEDFGPISPKQKEVLEDMQSMNKRMTELINGFLNISRIDLGFLAIEPVLTDIIALCDEVIKEMQSRVLEKGHTVTWEFDEKLRMTNVDPKLMRVIFQNYISNAVKYTQSNGRIKISLYEKDGKFVFSVANNGESIPEADQARIFGKLFRASNAVGQDPSGTGLGLYIVQNIAKEGGGEAWFTSHPGEDTVFYASFPLSGMLRKEGLKSLS